MCNSKSINATVATVSVSAVVPQAWRATRDHCRWTVLAGVASFRRSSDVAVE
jgi:hypothetical protein